MSTLLQMVVPDAPQNLIGDSAYDSDPSRPTYKLSAIGGDELGDAYEVVLSFAGEDREYVEQVAQILKASHVALFYDNYEEASLWGKNLIEHFHKVYSGSGRYCVMFISAAYAEKVWPTHERRSAFEKGH